MCIIYFASHTGCHHHHFLGCGNCSLNCPTDARHTFLLDDNGFECQTCAFLRGEELDPDIIPVTYYAPLFDTDKILEKEETKGYVQSVGSLSDPESETEEWRRDGDELEAGYGRDDGFVMKAQQDVYTPTRHAQQDAYNPAQQDAYSPAPPNTFLYPQMTPRTAAHRNLVQVQLKTLPYGGQMVQPHVAPLSMGLIYIPSGWHTKVWPQPLQVHGTPEGKGKDKA